MKQPPTKLFLRGVLTVLVLLLFTRCQKEIAPEAQQQEQNLKTVSSNYLNAKEIPKVMEYLIQKNHGSLTFSLQGAPDTREPDLTVGEINTNDILQLTDGSLSNYTFKMDKTQPDGELSFLNLVVKETSDGTYSYIMKIRPDYTWLMQNGGILDLINYTGDIVLYTTNGIYVHKTTFSNGEPISWDTRDPCPPETSGGGGSESEGGGTGTTPPSFPGTGGGQCFIEITCEIPCTCLWHCNRSICTCPNPPVISMNVICIPLKTPCPPPSTIPPECYLPNGDPCPLGCDAQGNCIEELPPAGVNIPLIKNPCDHLNFTTTEDANVNTLIKNIIQNTQDREKSFQLNLNPNTGLYQPTDIETSEERLTAKIHFNGSVIVFIHSHPSQAFGMFSGNDVLSIYSMYARYYSNDVFFNNFTMMLVYGSDVFAIKMGSFATIAKFEEILSNEMKTKRFTDAFEKYYEVNHSPLQLKEDFFNVLEQFDLDIALFQADVSPNDMITGWNEVDKETLTLTPCE